MKTFRTKKTMLLSALLLGALSVGTNFGSLPTASAAAGTAQAQAATPFQEEKLDMTNKWDKVFPESKNVPHEIADVQQLCFWCVAICYFKFSSKNEVILSNGILSVS